MEVRRMGTEDVKAVRPELLRLIETVTLSAVDEFDPREHFKEGLIGGVPVTVIGPRMQELLDSINAVEPPLVLTVVRVYELGTLSGYGKAAETLGVVAREELPFGVIWSMVEGQKDGRPGSLSVTRPNAFRVRGNPANSVGVVACTYRGGWRFEAYSLSQYVVWDRGCRFITR
jgi:hypothetical protein